MSIEAVIIDLVKTAIADLAGGKSPAAAAEDVAISAADKVIATIPAAIHAALAPYLEMLGVVVAIEDLAASEDKLLEQLRNPPTSTIPKILDGADVQVMPDAWHPEPEPIAPIAEPPPLPDPPATPEGSSDR